MTEQAQAQPPARADGAAPARVLVVEDETTYRELLVRQLQRRGYEVLSAGSSEEALERAAGVDLDVAILDVGLPGISGVDLLRRLREARPTLEAIVLTGHGSVETAIEAIKLGAFHYFSKPVKFAELELYVTNALEKRRLARENQGLREELARSAWRVGIEIVGEHASIGAVRALIGRFAGSPSPVLIEGESGTGKDLAACAIHAASPRRERPFIAINCGALSESLLENELFGHVAGAFTGATKEGRGLFEVAEGGSLFIDEVCEMSLEIQKKFLRVLENGEFRRLGESRIRKADVRVVAATNRVMKEEVAKGRFREDLSYRLNVLAIRMPPLRERASDVPQLVEHFLKRDQGVRYPKGIRVSEELLQAFRRYKWPGNVRELQNVLERAALLSEDGTLRLEHCPGLTEGQEPARAAPAAPATTETTGQPGGDEPPDDAASLEEIERRHIRRTLDRCQGNKTEAAKRLQVSLRSLYRKLEKLGIK